MVSATEQLPLLQAQPGSIFALCKKLENQGSIRLHSHNMLAYPVQPTSYAYNIRNSREYLLSLSIVQPMQKTDRAQSHFARPLSSSLFEANYDLHLLQS